MRVIGQKIRTDNQRAQTDIGSLWAKVDEIMASLPEHGDLIAVYTEYAGDHTQPYTYILGAEVGSDAVVPEGLTAIEIPEGNYQEFLVQGPMPVALIEKWQEIWQSNLARAYTTDFERYTADGVSIYLSVS